MAHSHLASLLKKKTCKVGKLDCVEAFNIDPAKKITKIECIMNKEENALRINFHHNA